MTQEQVSGIKAAHLQKGVAGHIDAAEEMMRVHKFWKFEHSGDTWYVLVQDDLLHWQFIKYRHANEFTIGITDVLHTALFYATPIDSDSFTTVQNQALQRLVRTHP